MTALRYNINTMIEDGTGDVKVGWTLNWDGSDAQKEHQNTGLFNIPRWDQKWRGGFFSCNGFDMTVPEGTVKDLGFDNVWKHLNSIHNESPFHILVWGGDQVIPIVDKSPNRRSILISYLRIFHFSRGGSIWIGITSGATNSQKRHRGKSRNTTSTPMRKVGNARKLERLSKVSPE